jgi:predicted TPR repeat methyltransferase
MSKKGAKINRSSYDTISQKWSEVRDQNEVSQLIIDLERCLPRDAHILDIGCGTGKPIAQYFAECGHQITGIDASANMIDIAQQYYIDKASFVSGDFFEFKTSEKFDAIIMWDSIFHFDLKRHEEAFRIISSMMKLDAYILFTYGDVNEDQEHTNPMMGEDFYYAALSRQHVYECLERSGIKIIYEHKKYIEKGFDRDWIVCGQLKT